MDEREQLEALKDWWRINGARIVSLLVIVGLAIVGWRGWQWYQETSTADASAVYRDFFGALGIPDPEQEISSEARASAELLAERLKTEYANSSYALFAAMILAREAVHRGDLEGAETELNWALTTADSIPVRDLVRLRLARIQIARDQTDAALDTLAQIENRSTLAVQVAELQGDAYYRSYRLDRARSSYQEALDADTDLARANVLKMKIADIASAAPADANEDEPGAQRDPSSASTNGQADSALPTADESTGNGADVDARESGRDAEEPERPQPESEEQQQ